MDKKDRLARFAQMVRVLVAKRGMRSVRELEPLIGIPDRNIYRRLNGETDWTLPELWRLFKVLKPTAEELQEMMMEASE